MSEKKIKKEKVLKILYFTVLVSFILPIFFLIIMTVIAPGEADLSRDKSDYILMIGECVLGIFVINIPSILAKKLKFDFPVTLNIMYLIFLYCAIVLGEVHSFYYIVPHWDAILHCFSSMMLGIFGFMFVSLINKDKNTAMNLSPLFVAIFAFCFAVSIGVLWEFYEYIADFFWGTNMQKYRLQDGTLLMGNSALSDTMEDLFIDATGALIVSVSGFFGIKKKKDGKIKNYINPDDNRKTSYLYLPVNESPSLKEICDEAEKEKNAQEQYSAEEKAKAKAEAVEKMKAKRKEKGKGKNKGKFKF